MSYQLTFKKSAAKELRKLSKPVKTWVIQAIDKLAKEPRPAEVKKLKGLSQDLWRIRVGDYRIIYSISDKIRVINVRKVGHRRDVYE